jgi:hypothetical protein
LTTKGNDIMFDFLWDLRQQRQIWQAQNRAGRASHQATEAKVEAQHVQLQLENLLLINAALWELMKESLNLSEEMLMAKVQEVDLRDGQLDGRMSTNRLNETGEKVGPRACPKCNRVFAKRHMKCIYCGEPKESAF